MPKYYAAGISAHLSTLKLADTVTLNIKARKNDAASNSGIVETRLRNAGNKMEEEPEGFPGMEGYGIIGEEKRPFRLGFLNNVPFKMVRVETADEDVNSHSDKIPQALVLHIELTEKSFHTMPGATRPQHLMIDVFFNGILASSVLVHLRDIKTGAKSFEQIFAGVRCKHLAEHPWVIFPPSATEHFQGDSSTQAVIDRWERISRMLRDEADARGVNRLGERSPSGEYLKNLAQLEIPASLSAMRQNGPSFGTVDLVVTSGYGNKTTVSYLKRPARLVDHRYTRMSKESLPQDMIHKDRQFFGSSMDAEGGNDSGYGDPVLRGQHLSSMHIPQFPSTTIFPSPLDPVPSLSSSPAFINPMDLEIIPQLNHPFASNGHTDAAGHRTHLRSRPAFPIPPHDSAFHPTFAMHNSYNELWSPSGRSCFRGLGHGAMTLQMNIPPAIEFPLIGPMPIPRGPLPAIGLFSTSSKSRPASSVFSPRLTMPVIDPWSNSSLPRPSSPLVLPRQPLPDTGIFVNSILSPPSSRAAVSSPTDRKSTPSRIMVSHVIITMGFLGIVDHIWSTPQQIAQDNTKSSGQALSTANKRPMSSQNMDINDEDAPIMLTQSVESPSKKQNRTTSNDIFNAQSPKAVLVTVKHPEKLFRQHPRIRRCQAHGLAVSSNKDLPTAHVAPPESRLHGVIDFMDDGSSLSSVPSSPYTITPNRPPQVEIRPPSSTVYPESTPSLHITPSSILSTFSSDLEKNNEPPSKRHHAPKQHNDDEVNPSINQNCVIQFADGMTEAGTPVLRQVKGEKPGVFKEDMVVVGMRFLVLG
ncbi:hypothetical protein B0J11DRAFT_186104 [Dendryphion nanum]|uniref:Uncharacterized protein n=1 Tax=Dendryphion nanum TaxID=256645 RepID=A0A9P9I913_9PLEO|nr:hypothetical protein B0J11DRAFT_186104 [Dendryphion nanum]